MDMFSGYKRLYTLKRDAVCVIQLIRLGAIASKSAPVEGEKF